jgi:hypothetical protein
VVNELFSMLVQKPDKALLDKITYYDLDGATCIGCKTFAAASKSFKYSCVGAKQGKVVSYHLDTMQTCENFIPVDFTDLGIDTGCTGPMCMHGCLINTRAASFGKNGPVSPSISGYYEDPNISVTSYFLNK